MTKKITLASIFIMPFLEKLARKSLFGKPKVTVGDFITVSGYAMESGAIIGKAFRHKELTLEKIIVRTDHVGNPGESISEVKSIVKKRKEAFEKDRHKTSSAGFGVLTFMSILRDVFKVDVSSYSGLFNNPKVIEIFKTKITLTQALQFAELRFFEGLGYGVLYPGIIENMVVPPVGYSEQYRDAGLVLEDIQPPTYKEREYLCLNLLKKYVVEFMPELQDEINLLSTTP